MGSSLPLALDLFCLSICVHKAEAVVVVVVIVVVVVGEGGTQGELGLRDL